MIQFTISAEEAGMTIKQYLQRKHKFSGRLMTRLTRDKNNIRVNNENKLINDRLQTNDLLTVKFPKESIGERLIAEQIPLNIVYEDQHLLVINKAPHIAVLPSFTDANGTIANGVLGYYQTKNLPYTVHIVTRLDRNTSGLMIIAKHHYSHSRLAQMIDKKQIQRKYTAIVQGVLTDHKGTMTYPIGRQSGSIIKRTVTETGKRAVTNYEVQAIGKNFTVVTIELETGRTHQIRVHFAHLGHPIIGDGLYGEESEQINRQALHCHQLNFVHPITKMPMTFQANIPSDMGEFLSSSVNL